MDTQFINIKHGNSIDFGNRNYRLSGLRVNGTGSAIEITENGKMISEVFIDFDKRNASKISARKIVEKSEAALDAFLSRPIHEMEFMDRSRLLVEVINPKHPYRTVWVELYVSIDDETGEEMRLGSPENGWSEEEWNGLYRFHESSIKKMWPEHLMLSKFEWETLEYRNGKDAA